MQPVITPTVGRIVHYYPRADEEISFNGREPLAAIITAVWDDRTVGLSVFGAGGQQHARPSVRLVQPFDAYAMNPGGYCRWMPYQVEKAGT